MASCREPGLGEIARKSAAQFCGRKKYLQFAAQVISPGFVDGFKPFERTRGVVGVTGGETCERARYQTMLIAFVGDLACMMNRADQIVAEITTQKHIEMVPRRPHNAEFG